MDYGDNEIPRCVSPHCRAYLCPFTKWIDGGERWVCHLCRCVNITSDYYFNKLNQQNIRIDSNTKIDLAYGSYEYVANKTYRKSDKPSMFPIFIFAIDVSLASIQNNFLTAVIESIKDVIAGDSLLFCDKTKVAFITYDTSIHFYNLKNNQPVMLCVKDDELFLPCPINNLLISLNDNKKNVLNLLDLIQNSFINTTCKDSNKIFHAVNAAYILANKIGGRLLIFNASQSMTSLPKMKSKNSGNLPKEEIIYSPTDDKQLSQMGINLTNENICCELFVTSDTFIVIFIYLESYNIKSTM